MASGWPRTGSVRASSALPLRCHITAGGSAARRQRASAAALSPRPPTLISPSPVRVPLLLELRQHLLDHLGVVGAALVDLAVDGEHPEHAALGRRVVEAGIAAQPRQDSHVLLAIQLVGDRRGVDAGAGLELPQLLAGLGLVGT